MDYDELWIPYGTFFFSLRPYMDLYYQENEKGKNIKPQNSATC